MTCKERPPGFWQRDYTHDLNITLVESSAMIWSGHYVGLIMLSAALRRSMSMVIRGACSDLLRREDGDLHGLLGELVGSRKKKSLRDWHEIDGWVHEREARVTPSKLLNGMAEVERLVATGRVFSGIMPVSASFTKTMIANISHITPQFFSSKSAFIRQAIKDILARCLWPAMTREDLELWLPRQEED
jgi:Arc/MetJ-type ribon-helix-helix transcriptional regulator